MGLPVIKPLVLDFGFSQMVNHHGKFGKLLPQLLSMMKMFDIEKQVKGNMVLFEYFQSA